MNIVSAIAEALRDASFHACGFRQLISRIYCIRPHKMRLEFHEISHFPRFCLPLHYYILNLSSRLRTETIIRLSHLLKFIRYSSLYLSIF